ncbi:MAG TPA: NADH-quinone oxidoreductase subunit NuoE [Anaerolineae bacterium]
MWSEKEQQELDQILKKYPNKLSAVMPALYLAQREKNWLDDDDIEAVAGALDISVTHVHSIIGFYTLYRKEPVGKYMVQVCTDLPCALRGAEDFYHRLCERLGVGPGGGTTTDGLFTLEGVVCIAACDKAPCLQINLAYYESLTDEQIDQVIVGLRAGEQSP